MFTLQTRSVLSLIAISLGIPIGFCGCHLAPKYSPPQVATPPAFKELTGGDVTSPVWQPAQPTDAAIRGDWWTTFDDPELNALEAKANVSNQNIAAAAANYQTALAIVREARASFFPTATAGASATNNRVSVVPAINIKSGTTYTEYTLPIEASWEPDLWGKMRNSVHSMTFQAQEQAALLENVRLAEHVQIAVSYFLIHAQDSLLLVLDESIRADQQTVTLTRALYDAGLTTDEALSAAEAQLASALAQRDGVRITRAQYEHALAVLLGESPASFAVEPTPLPNSLPIIPVSIPARLLERRPDIAAAERSVAAANSQVGLARSAYFPDVLLTGSFGVTALDAASWLSWPSRVWAAGPSIAETVFDAGLRHATVQEHRYRYDSAVATYRQTVLNAFQQVEDNLVALRVLHTEIQEQDQAVAAAQRAFEEAATRYQSGLDPYLNVVQTQQTLLSYRQSLVGLLSQQTTSTLNLVLALGGGWDEKQIPAAKQIMRARLP